jgi:hypothetical protein
MWRSTVFQYFFRHIFGLFSYKKKNSYGIYLQIIGTKNEDDFHISINTRIRMRIQNSLKAGSVSVPDPL